ncbi:hypothetical protein [Candidatus Nitronereus thalassa]|uniref:DUF4868 domain-containing protein n=1 Tax=Candidatus Nitronereus thalassa TaxID=3020898 RepID=A0ABU3K8A1_9BACT|nr:hypothetical protein [Candidatus Nitronereus thalassa]MDT7042674.1 hypothetical protein [Candidatus Nitronereus thalassa]
MLENFQLAAIVKTGGQMGLYQIPLHQALQKTLAKNWQAQYESFTNNIHEIDFDAGYNPEQHERFRLEAYELPDWLSGENSQAAPNLDSISKHEDLIESIKGIVAFARNDNGEELMLFQNFSRSHVIKPGRFLFLQNNTYESAERPGLTLGGKLSALYLSSQHKLLFHNFRIANTFLPLADFYQEASEHEIREVLEHHRLAPDNPDAVVADANQWFRKRFAMLKDSKILDKYSAKKIKSLSQGYEVDVQLKGNKIIFPADKTAAKRLLQFLNEELYRGPITETLYETNSKREAD